MDLFLSQAHTGSTLLGSYKTQQTNVSCQRRRKLGVGEPTKADFSRTISGVASSLYLVNPGAPSNRERMVRAASLPDSFVFNYRDIDTVMSSEAPAWCPFNDPAFHEHIFKRLERAGLANRSKFVTNPIKAAGELCGFRYTGGSTPQNLIFPVGSTEINWLVALRNATRLGTVAASASDAEERMSDLKAGTPPKLVKQALKRLRIWRAINWIAESTRSSGMIRYEPFSVGCALYENEVRKMQLKGKYERSMLYLGDHYSKESVLLGDIAQGGLASDFWTVVEAVLEYKKNHAAALENDRLAEINDNKNITVEDWTNTLASSRLMNEHGDSHKVQKTLEAAIEDFGRVGETRRSHLIEFIKTCLTPEQRESLYKGVGNKISYQASLINLADSILANSAKSGVWIMLHSLLKQITFNILHLVGYEAHRQLIFKIFLPAMIALFLAQDGIGDSFVHGVLNLEVLKERVANASIQNMLSRDTTSSLSGSARNYAEYDIATLYGKLSDCASIPLAINVGIPLHKAVMNMNTVDLVVKHIINTGLAKQRTAADNRIARRLQHRRKIQEQAGREQQRQEEIEELIEEASESEEEEGRSIRTKSPPSNAPIPLTKGKYRENIAGFAIETIQNKDRQINVESIQKLLTARYTKNRNRRSYEGDDSGTTVYTDNEMTEVFIKYIMNFFDKVFHFKQGTILNSIHSNRRTENGVYTPSNINCDCPENHNENCVLKIRNRDATCAESKNPVSFVDLGDLKQVASRLQELIMDPPSLSAVDDAMAIERVLQNEQMLTVLLTNPIFNAVLGAEKGDLGRYVVLCNIVKFMNVLIACLVDGDLPLLAETRSGVKTALEKGKIRNTRKRPFSSSTIVDDAQASSFQYIDAGHCPGPGLKEMLLPECMSKLKSIAMEKGRGGRSAQKRQNCDHSFCRLLKFLFFSIEPSKSVDTFTDPASRATLFLLDDICRDRKKYKSVEWEKYVIKPIKLGTKDWVKPGEYTPASASILDDASPVDFYRKLKSSMLLENVIPIPPPVDGYISSVRKPDDLLTEAKNTSCEGFRPLLFNYTTVLTTEPSTSNEDEKSNIELKETEQPQEQQQRPPPQQVPQPSTSHQFSIEKNDFLKIIDSTTKDFNDTPPQQEPQPSTSHQFSDFLKIIDSTTKDFNDTPPQQEPQPSTSHQFSIEDFKIIDSTTKDFNDTQPQQQQTEYEIPELSLYDLVENF